MTDVDTFTPNWFSIPGTTIRAAMSERAISTSQLCEMLGVSRQEVSDLLNGRQAIDGKTALALERALGAPAKFWLAREKEFQASLKRCASKVDSVDAKKWLSEVPSKAMQNLGWIATTNERDVLESCLAFFDIPNLEQWRKKYQGQLKAVAFRASNAYEAVAGSVVSWLRFGELLAADIDCAPWNKARFIAQLQTIKALTRRKSPAEFLPELRDLCAQCGVALVVARAPKGCSAHGATRFVAPGKAMILLSFRYLTDDHFWFTFFHEAGHLVMHDKTALFVEQDDEMTTHEEEQANQFSADMLIPPSLQDQLATVPLNPKAIIRFARACGVAPGVVVGQLQHAGRLPHGRLNSMKRRYSWDEISSYF